MYQGRFSAVLRLKGSFSVQSCTVSTCPPELTNHSDAQHKPGTVVQQAKRKDFRLISLWMIYCLLQSTRKEIWNHSDSGFIPSKSYIYFVTRTAHRATSASLLYDQLSFPWGNMFGKGIYFADMVSKSANYCVASKSNPVVLLLLCDVALDNWYVV